MPILPARQVLCAAIRAESLLFAMENERPCITNAYRVQPYSSHRELPGARNPCTKMDVSCIALRVYDVNVESNRRPFKQSFRMSANRATDACSPRNADFIPVFKLSFKWLTLHIVDCRLS